MLGTVTERALWSDSLVSESTVQVRGYQASVQPQGTAPMQLLPGDDARQLLQHAVPVADHVSADPDGVGLGQAAIGAAPVQGRTRSAHQQLRRHERQPSVPRSSVGRHAGRAASTPPAPSAQMLRTTDVALYAQDRVQPNARWYFEFGARLDRDGVVGRWNVTPRVGAALLLNEHGQLGAARRLRPVLRADAVGRGRLQVRAVRNVHRYADSPTTA